tara:strand:- start:6574 stop:8001 length:1428 start_codon:yes stop_codon:yes gene_type:complete
MISDFNKIKKMNFENSIQTAIYGSGYSGKKIASQLKLNKTNVDCFIDDNLSKIGSKINGIKVISYEQLKIISKKYIISNIIVAIPSLSESENSKLVKKLYPYALTISSLPRKFFFKRKDIKLIDIENISIDQILNKTSFAINKKTLKSFRNKNILITGGAGSIGSEIAMQLIKSECNKICILDNSELNMHNFIKKKLLGHISKFKFILDDIKNEKFLTNLIKLHQINYIFHTAAYKHVNYLEDNVHGAVSNNIFGTISLLNSIKNMKINVVFISTDKAANPKNILGITKRLSEIIIQSYSKLNEYKNSKFSIVRFGNVIGSAGSALPIFFNQILSNKPITITDIRMKRFFMSMKEACGLVIEASQIKSNGYILILKMGKQIKIINIVKKMFKLLSTDGQKLKIKIIGKNKNEKISEVLSSSKIFYKTNVDKIMKVKEKSFNRSSTFCFMEKLNKDMKNINNKGFHQLVKSFFKKL